MVEIIWQNKTSWILSPRAIQYIKEMYVDLWNWDKEYRLYVFFFKEDYLLITLKWTNKGELTKAKNTLIKMLTDKLWKKEKDFETFEFKNLTIQEW